MTVIVRRFGHVAGYTDEFVEAMWQLQKEKGGGYVPIEEVQRRADTLQVVQPLPKLPPLINPELLPKRVYKLPKLV